MTLPIPSWAAPSIPSLPVPSPASSGSQEPEPGSSQSSNAPNGTSATATSCNTGVATPPGQCGPAGVTDNLSCGGLQCSYQMGPYSNGVQTGVWIQVTLPTDGGGQWVQSYSFCFVSCSPPQPDTPNGQSSPSPFYSSMYSNGQIFWDDPARPSGTTSMTWTAETSYVQPGQTGAAFTLQWGWTLSSNGSVGYTAPVPATPSPYQQTLIKQANSSQPGPQ